ncbi:class I SAM-dependent methyltransferase [Halalkalicoccus sp. NIPERK01]|uniref:class I SAM-dependent methyltransferase n=1 Tax=Halalkalicoccus sp. NIPERK01 TaxID=3053469 RepID=UPI00256F4CA3|nr:class I SAM-dependent methyltransferase [Halalkalicoccus sp. NIPERK01]MDL5362314.1 class I SAM-dependent methyltransferase [Halalkalicoccus sp. NIPERK01]
MDRFRNTRQPDWGWWGELWPEPERLLCDLGLEADRSLADVGSGDGYFTLPAAGIVAPAPVYAIDIDPALLEDLREAAAERGLSNVTPIEGDARDLEALLPEPVDDLLVANTFHGIEDPAEFVRRAYRSLAPGGRLIVVNWHDRPKAETTVAGAPRGPPEEVRLPPAETRRRVRAAPFAAVDEVDLPPYHYALVCER